MKSRLTYAALEQLLADRTRELKKATAGLTAMEKDYARREELMKIQRDLSLSLATIYDLREGLHLGLAAGLRVSGMDCGGIYLFDQASGDLRLQVHQGLTEQFVRAVAHFAKDSENVRYIQKGVPKYTQHNHIDVPLSPTEHREGLQAFISIPLTDGDKVVGCMNLGSKKDKTVPQGPVSPLKPSPRKLEARCLF